MDNAEELKAAMLAKLNAGEWGPGQRIAPERELGQSYGIGRSAVRRVLAELKTAGIITQTVGSGTYVSDSFVPSPSAVSLRPADSGGYVSPYELMEARLAIEISIVDMIIRNASQGDFAQMALCCDKAEAATSMKEFEVWDGQLHETMALAAHNALITQIFQLIKQGRSQDDWGALKRGSLTPERRAAYELEHRQIVNALCDRDLVRAVAATRAHLLHVRSNLLGI